jgi:hypothetical protein
MTGSDDRFQDEPQRRVVALLNEGARGFLLNLIVPLDHGASALVAEEDRDIRWVFHKGEFAGCAVGTAGAKSEGHVD